MSREPRLSVERRGIEFVPHAERYGTPQRLFTIWFSINLGLLCLTAGTLGVMGGLPLGAALMALTLGNAIGTVFMAAHSAQGPHLGIPQMIQSRAQFGVIGAGLPLFAVVAAATLFTAADGVIIRETVQMIVPLSDSAAMVLFATITLVIGFFGYELIHRLGATLSVLSGALFVIVAAIVLIQGHASGARPIQPAHFTLPAFIVTVTQATSFSLCSAPYVADYSRYLPMTVSSWRTFWFTGTGNFLGTALIMGLGAYIASSNPYLAQHLGLGIAGLFGPGRYLVGMLIVAGLLQVNVMNLYSAYMSTVTIFTGIRRMSRIGLISKFAAMSALMVVATAIAIATKDDFDRYFANVLDALVSILVPWSAINLADYYLVRKGRYLVDQVYDVNGIYGRYQWKSIAVYLLGILIQVPFIRLSFYAGPLVRLIGADVAWLPGMLVPTIVYWLIYAPRANCRDASLSIRAP